MQLDFKQENSPRLKPWWSPITTTKTNSRQGSKPLTVYNPLASSCLLGRRVGVLQTPGHRSPLWQLWQTQSQVAKWDAIIKGGGKNMTLTFYQSTINEVMHLSAQTITDNRQCRKNLQETREHGGGCFMGGWGEKKGGWGTSTRAVLASAGNQVYSWLPGAGAQWVQGPRHTRTRAPQLPWQPQRCGLLPC